MEAFLELYGYYVVLVVHKIWSWFRRSEGTSTEHFLVLIIFIIPFRISMQDTFTNKRMWKISWNTLWSHPPPQNQRPRISSSVSKAAETLLIYSHSPVLINVSLIGFWRVSRGTKRDTNRAGGSGSSPRTDASEWDGHPFTWFSGNTNRGKGDSSHSVTCAVSNRVNDIQRRLSVTHLILRRRLFPLNSLLRGCNESIKFIRVQQIHQSC